MGSAPLPNAPLVDSDMYIRNQEEIAKVWLKVYEENQKELVQYSERCVVLINVLTIGL